MFHKELNQKWLFHFHIFLLSGNEDIEQQSLSYKSEIEDFFDRIYKVLKYKVKVIDLNEIFKEAEDEVDEKEMNDDESQN